MWISIWHYDRFGKNEFLGEVRIPLGDYQGSEVAPDWYPLLPAVSKYAFTRIMYFISHIGVVVGRSQLLYSSAYPRSPYYP